MATLLNSGNAVFCAPATHSATHGKRIAVAIASRFGFDISVVVQSAAEFAAVVQGNIFAATASDHSQLLTLFAQESETLSALAFIAPLVVPPEAFAIGPHAAYLHCASGILESKAGAALLTKVGRQVTTRNWATVLKVQSMLQAGA